MRAMPRRAGLWHHHGMPPSDLDAALARMADLEEQIAMVTAEVERLQEIIEAAGLPAVTASVAPRWGRGTGVGRARFSMPTH